jgi:hypothetical protein
MDLRDVIRVVEEHADDLMNHNNRICNIEVSNARVDTQIENLIKSLDGLTASIKLVLIGTLGACVGFIIWYIQQI